MKLEFISAASHDLRTLSPSINGALGPLVEGALGELSDRAQVLATIASSKSEPLARLVNKILELEDVEAGKIEFRPEPHLI